MNKARRLTRYENIEYANQLLAAEEWSQAVVAHARAMLEFPAAGDAFRFGFELAQRHDLQQRQQQPAKVAIASWELSHNPAGRALALADLYQAAGYQPEIIGFQFARFGQTLWAPMKSIAHPVHAFQVDEAWHADDPAACHSDFLTQAIQLVSSHPYDVVHLSKPRGPNLLLGLLYRWIWQARVICDIDDEELGFFNKHQPIDKIDDGIDAWISTHGRLPHLAGLTRKQWTYFAVGCVHQFDAVTVSNPALQQRYGGDIIPHTRLASLFAMSPERKAAAREAFGIAEDAKVVLFFGTPRKHKGLSETVAALSTLNDSRIVYVVVGEFPDAQDKAELEQQAADQGVNLQCFGNQPYSAIADVVAMGDLAVNFQDTQSPVAQFQVPAKLTDALAAGLVVLASETPALADFFAAGALVPVTAENLSETLRRFLDSQGAETLRREQCERGLNFFHQHLATESYVDQLRLCLNAWLPQETQAPVALRPLPAKLAGLLQQIVDDFADELQAAFCAGQGDSN